MRITFLGTNGWYDDKNGSTMCTLVETDNEYIIVDAGFGLQYASKYIKKDKPIYLYISHVHIDHICGLHGLSGFRPTQGITILCTRQVKRAINRTIASPYTFPLNKFNFNVAFEIVKEGGQTLPFNFTIFKMKHIDPTYGIKINHGGKSVTYCCDTAPCEKVIKSAHNTDILIFECSLRPGAKNTDWGHTSPDDAARVAKKSKTKKLFLSHFVPGYNDKKTVAKLLKAAKAIFPNTEAAKDGLTIKL